MIVVLCLRATTIKPFQNAIFDSDATDQICVHMKLFQVNYISNSIITVLSDLVNLSLYFPQTMPLNGFMSSIYIELPVN